MRPDPLSVFNERVKLLAGFSNAVGLGLIGLAVLRPVIEPATAVSPASLWWGALGLAFHGLAHYILGKLKRKEAP